ncbi:MAG TPA: c-type cytochrome [Virgibacillus sp.]|nr:c-type cytochrome [Virgibacillus sp.]
MKRGKGMQFVGDSRVSAERTPNIPKDYSEYPGRTEAFWPNFLLKEWLVGSVFLVGFLSVVLAHPSPLESVADPTVIGYTPLPDWYFLFLYELLKYEFAAGKFIIMGILVIPGLAFGALLLAPFLDNGPGRRPPQRPIAVAMMILGLSSVVWLTYESASAVDWEQRAEENKPIPPSAIEIDESHAGFEIYENSCMSCHGDSLEGGPAGPGLIGTEYGPEDIAKIAVDGIGTMPADQFTGTDEELEELVDFIMTVNEQAEQ